VDDATVANLIAGNPPSAVGIDGDDLELLRPSSVARFLSAASRMHVWPAMDIDPETAFRAARQGWLRAFLPQALRDSAGRKEQTMTGWNFTRAFDEASQALHGKWELERLGLDTSLNRTEFGPVAVGGLSSYAASLHSGQARRSQVAGLNAVVAGQTVAYDADSVFSFLVPVADLVGQMAQLSATARQPPRRPQATGSLQPEVPRLPGLSPPG